MDTIAELLQSTQSAIVSCFDAVGTKGGTIPTKKNAMTLVTAIYSIYPDDTSPAPTVAPVSPTVDDTLDSLETHLRECYAAVEYKGGIIPTNKNWENLTEAILSIAADYGTVYYTDDGVAKSYKLKSQTELDAMGSSSQSFTIQIGDLSIPNTSVTAFSVGKQGTLPNYFLHGCTSLTALNNQENLKNIPNEFMMRCSDFNQALTIPEGITSIGTDFLFQCTKFNSPVSLPSSLSSVGRIFMGNCSSFDKPITFPDSLKAVPEGCLSSCTAFNSAIVLPSTVTSIGSSFLNACRAFNQPLTLPATLKTIYSDFMISTNAFAQPLIIPASVTSIGGGMLRSANNFTGPLTINTTTATLTSSNLTLTVTAQLSVANTMPLYNPGVLVNGPGASRFIDAYPNCDEYVSTSPYKYPRHLRTA